MPAVDASLLPPVEDETGRTPSQAFDGGTDEVRRQLKRLVPDAWRDGTLDPQKLLAILGFRTPASDNEPAGRDYWLTYRGKLSEAEVLADTPALPIQQQRLFSAEAASEGWHNMLIQGDNLSVLRRAVNL